MPRRKKNYKRRRRKNKALINRGVNPLPNTYITTVELNDICNGPAALATYYGIWKTNSAFLPFQATNLSNISNESAYGWASLSGLYNKYSVLWSSIEVECHNGTSVPIRFTIAETSTASVITNEDNILGLPNSKSTIVSVYGGPRKLRLSSSPSKMLGLSTKDNTYTATMSAAPASLRYYQVLVGSMDNGSTAISCFFKVKMKFKVRLTDRTNLVQA